MDVPELRSRFRAKDLMEHGRIISGTSGGEFGKTLCGCSQTRGDLSESSLLSEDPCGLPVSTAAESEKIGVKGEGAVSMSFCGEGHEVPDLKEDFEGDPQGPFPKSIGAGGYSRLSTGDGTSSEELLCENFRQLKLSARVFGEKKGQMSGETSSGKVHGTEVGEHQEPDVSDEGSPAVSGDRQTEPLFFGDDPTEIALDVVFPLPLSPLPDGESMVPLQDSFSGSAKTLESVGALRADLSVVPEVQAEHVLGRPVTLSVVGANDNGKGSPAQVPLGGVAEISLPTPESEEEPGSVKLFTPAGGVPGLPAGESAVTSFSEEVLGKQAEHVLGQPAVASVPDPLGEVAETFSQTLEGEDESTPLKPFSPVVGASGLETVESAVTGSSEELLGRPSVASVTGANAYGKGSPPKVPFRGVGETFSQSFESVAKPGSVKSFSPVVGASALEMAESAVTGHSEEVLGRPAVASVTGANAYGKGSPPKVPFLGATETFSQAEGVTSLTFVESAGEEPSFRPDSNASGDVPSVRFMPADGDKVAPGQNPDVSIKGEDVLPVERSGFVVQPGPGERVLEGTKDVTIDEEGFSSSPLALNPMEPMSLERVGREVLLEARGVEAMAQGLAETVHVVRKRDGHRGTIEVSPPNLGQVRITVDSSGDTVRVHLRVDSVQVRDMLDQTADVLKQAMADRGLSLAGMSVDVGGQGGERSRGWGSAMESYAGSFGESGEVPVEEESEEVIARLDLERGMLHWVA